MEKVNVLTLININYKNFTKAEQKVADYISKDPKQVLYASITDIAERCGVGDTSVFRFCRTLGFNGYHEFRMKLAQSINSDEGASVQLSEEINQNDTLEDVCKKILGTNTNVLNETLTLLNYDAIQLSVEYAKKAKRIRFFGVGSSAVTAHEAYIRFMRITPKVDFTYDAHMQSMAASLMTAEDLAIVFSFSGSTKDIIDILKTVKATNAKIICITRYTKSPVTQYADVVLLTGGKEGPFQGGALSTKIAQLYLLDILYVEYFRKTMEISKRNKGKTAEAVSSKLL